MLTRSTRKATSLCLCPLRVVCQFCNSFLACILWQKDKTCTHLWQKLKVQSPLALNPSLCSFLYPRKAHPWSNPLLESPLPPIFLPLPPFPVSSTLAREALSYRILRSLRRFGATSGQIHIRSRQCQSFRLCLKKPGITHYRRRGGTEIKLMDVSRTVASECYLRVGGQKRRCQPIQPCQ